MQIRPIRTDKDHRAALAEINTCWGASEGTDEADRLDVLLALVEIYEAKRWPIDIDEVSIRLTCSTTPSRNSAILKQNWPSFWTRGYAHRKFSHGVAPSRSK